MIRVELFAAFSEFAGVKSIEIPFDRAITCGTVWQQITSKYPRLKQIKPLFAIENEYVPSETFLKDGEVLLIFPPVSGG